MSIQIYMDVHVPAPITRALRRRGVEVKTAQEDGTTQLEDDLLLDRASALNSALFTRDRDLLAEAKARQRTGRFFCGRYLCPSTPCFDRRVHQRFGGYGEGRRARRLLQSRGTFAVKIAVIAEFDSFGLILNLVEHAMRSLRTRAFPAVLLFCQLLLGEIITIMFR